MSGAVLFDLDNTLHDRAEGLRRFVAAQHARHGLAAHGIDLPEWTKSFLRLDENGRVWKDALYRALCERYRPPLAAERLLEEYEHEFASFVQPYEGNLEVLEACRRCGWKTGLVTNGRSAFQRRTMAALGIVPLLDVVVVSEECGLRKPDPRIFSMALQEIECDPRDSWFVGDDPVADVQGATAAGLRALLFSPGGEPGHDRIGSLDALLGRIAP